MSEAVQFELGPLTIAVVATRRGRTELRVSAFEQTLGTLTTTVEPQLDALLAAETEQMALFDLFKDHCAPLLRSRAQRGPGNSDALCLRLNHPCDNPQCNAVHELLCMNSANQLLAQATPAPAGTGTPFTLVDGDGHPLADTVHLGEADTERLLLEHAAPPLVEMANFFTPACMETDLERWDVPTAADQDIINYFGFFSGSPDAVYGIFQYVNPLLLSIWMERIDAYAHDRRAQDKAAAQEAWFKLMAKLLVLPENHLAASAARPREAGAHLLHATAPTRRLH